MLFCLALADNIAKTFGRRIRIQLQIEIDLFAFRDIIKYVIIIALTTNIVIHV